MRIGRMCARYGRRPKRCVMSNPNKAMRVLRTLKHKNINTAMNNVYMYVPGTTAERKYMPSPCHDEALQRMNKKVAPTELSLLQNKIGN